LLPQFLELHCKLEHGESRLVVDRDDRLGI
jgi:hypothetical protein